VATPYEDDINDQPAALHAFATAAPAAGLDTLDVDRYDRLILTGMGTSHYAALPTWRSLARRGRPVWWVEATHLLDTPELVTDRTLLWITSQSGRSGEVTALLDHVVRRTLLAVTNDTTSPLAQAADIVVPLHAGREATVSTKTYLNTLAAHQVVLAALLGLKPDRSEIATIAEALQRWLREPDPLSPDLLAAPVPRLALIGAGDQLATALTGALVLKEAAKVPAQAYTAGEFRHGPLELAGPGLTAILINDPASTANDLETLASTLRETGATVTELTPPVERTLGQLVYTTQALQRFSVAVAHANAVTPGEFRYGSKVTSTR
jgi:glucosamine--fructose-6-phosphate aminotransferase (isomerizing)